MGFAIESLKTRHVRTAFKTMPVKTDRKDVRGLAELRMVWFWPVRYKSMAAQELRAALTARRLFQRKLTGVELDLHGVLRGIGLKIGVTTQDRFPGRLRELGGVHRALQMIAEVFLLSRQELDRRVAHFADQVRNLAQQDPQSKLRVTTPVVRAIWESN